MTDYTLYNGSHTPYEGKRCAMEWVAYLAGEKHSDRPECVDSKLATFFIKLNDRLDDERRQMLRPYLARTIGTRDDGLRSQRNKSFASLGAAYCCTEGCVGCATDALMYKHDDYFLRAFLDRLLPTVPLQLPVAEDAAAVCAVQG